MHTYAHSKTQTQPEVSHLSFGFPCHYEAFKIQSHKAAKINDSYAKSRAHQHEQTCTCTHARIQKLKHCLKSRTCLLDLHVNTEPSKHPHTAANIKDNYAKASARQHKQIFTCTPT
jgi:hypothetical protein